MLPRTVAVGVILLVTITDGLIPSSTSAAEILLSQFSGNETLIDMSEIPGGGGGGAANLPPNNWDRTIKGVRFLGGADLGIGGRVPGEINSNPFQGTPTAGDPAGFQGASLGSWFTLFAPSSYTFSLDFQLLTELPKRVGFLWDQVRDLNQQVQPTLTTQLWFADTTSKLYTFAPQSTRLVAFEEDRGIKSIDFLWDPQTPFGTNGPRMNLDDLRVEAVPEPSSLILAVFGIASAAAGLWPTTRRYRLRSCFCLAPRGVR